MWRQQEHASRVAIEHAGSVGQADSAQGGALCTGHGTGWRSLAADVDGQPIVLNCVVLWNTIYMDKARAERQAAGRPIPDEILAGLSPLIFEHLNFSGRYPFNRPVVDRPLRDPDAPEDDD